MRELCFTGLDACPEPAGKEGPVNRILIGETAFIGGVATLLPVIVPLLPPFAALLWADRARSRVPIYGGPLWL